MKKVIIIFGLLYFGGCDAPTNYERPHSFNYPLSQRNIELNRSNELYAEITKLCDQNRFDEALQKCETEISFSYPDLQKEPQKNMFLVLVLKERYLEKTQEFHKAIPVMRLIIENCTDCSEESYATYYTNLAILLDRVGRTEEAVEAEKKSISYNPDKVGYYILLAQFLDAVGRQPEALQVLEKAVKVDPENARAYWGLGSLYFEQREYSKAIQVLNKCIQIEPDNFYANFFLSLAYKGAVMQKEYKQFLQKATDIDPNKAMKLLEGTEQNPRNSDAYKQVQK